ARAADGPAGPARGDRARRHRHGRGTAAGDAGARALAALPDLGCAGRRRQRLPRLYRPGALPALLVRAPARPRHEHRLLRRRRRLDRDAARTPELHHGVGLAERLLGLAPDGESVAAGGAAAARHGSVVDPAWVAIDWTLGRALRTRRFWWVALG